MELRRARQEELRRARQDELWNECIAAPPLPLPCLAHTIPMFAHLMGVPVTAKSREASDHQTPVLYSPTVHAGAQQGSHAPHGRRQPIPAWARAAIADGASTGSTRRSARARARESAVVGDASTGEGSTRRLRRERRQGHRGLGTAARMSNVCVCVYPTAVGRTVPAREVGTSRSMGHSGMAVPM